MLFFNLSEIDMTIFLYLLFSVNEFWFNRFEKEKREFLKCWDGIMILIRSFLITSLYPLKIRMYLISIDMLLVLKIYFVPWNLVANLGTYLLYAKRQNFSAISMFYIFIFIVALFINKFRKPKWSNIFHFLENREI